MRISVLIPCYNAERYVASAIRSVLDQTRLADEIIAIDDGSTDRTSSELEGFVPRISILRQPNRGVAAALNAGIAGATGDAIAFIDADDLWMPEKLALQVKMLASRRELHGVFGHMQNFADAGKPGHPSSSSYLGVPAPGLVKGTLLVQRDFVAKVGSFNEERRHADFISWCARGLATGFRWVMIPERVYLRRVHGANLGIRDRARQREDYLAALKDIIENGRAVTNLNRLDSSA